MKIVNKNIIIDMLILIFRFISCLKPPAYTVNYIVHSNRKEVIYTCTIRCHLDEGSLFKLKL